METFVAAIIGGLGTGAVYALLGVGFVIIYRATEVINFAQPALMILGAYASSAFVNQVGLPFWVSVVAGVLVLAASGC